MMFVIHPALDNRGHLSFRSEEKIFFAINNPEKIHHSGLNYFVDIISRIY